MQIDWLTVAAQWINFLILMWLLRRFLYQPIVQAMDKRQQTMAANARAAEQKMQQAEQEADNYRNQLAELETHRTALMTAARQAAENEREKLAKQARAEFEILSQQWRHDLAREKTECQNRLCNELSRLITATARKALQDLSSQELEQALFDNFLNRLNALSTREKQLLSASGPEDMALASSRELDEASRTRFADAMKRILPHSNVNVRFEVLPDSRLGLILTSPAYTLEWRVERYFEELQAELDTLLNRAASHAE
ncbi:MAG: hypothetical protein M0R33_11600 [Methylomonas sp.]|jgi:F-type H+-transporting ATPase subunit b|uniref:F0F1 ATP synthase subunit B family protein n=1 Tax=Methylomonas sp. TaxID=418 RepID=UPI0026005738|nr:hypothetical protein [Methylomonas sp.]MCK9607079.1 hypothetical protein [Methylomonas sp.]